ncbi:hypothetical protein GCM10009605_16370 [Nocardiopsis composta]
MKPTAKSTGNHSASARVFTVCRAVEAVSEGGAVSAGKAHLGIHGARGGTVRNRGSSHDRTESAVLQKCSNVIFGEPV